MRIQRRSLPRIDGENIDIDVSDNDETPHGILRRLARVDAKFMDRPDYREGANAYALRQAAVRTSLRDFCKKTWQHVPQWICLGGVEADEDEDLPDLVSLPDSESMAASEYA